MCGLVMMKSIIERILVAAVPPPAVLHLDLAIISDIWQEEAYTIVRDTYTRSFSFTPERMNAPIISLA